jgi:hypothetical protein
MKKYIDRDEFVKRLNENVELTNPEEQEWVKDECIRQAHAMPSVNVGEWISIDERLPDNGETVLTVDNEGYMIVASWYELGGWFLPVCRANPVTHWMPLPEPPVMKGK